MKAWVWAALAAACATGASCRGEPRDAPAPEPPAPAPLESEPIAPVPAAPREDPARVALGAQLFESPLLSGDGQVACASCHLREHGYADLAARSRPQSRPAMATNTPSLLNVAALDVFNWDGRFSELGEHLDALIVNPGVQATSWPAIESRLRADAALRERFAAVFPAGLSAASAREALLAFERSLVSPGAAFDRWLEGDAGALSEAARRGYGVFKSYGCVSCHQGALVGGNLFARLGVLRAFSGDDAPARDGELGRMQVTGLAEDRFVFRVPSLRNVALTAPYLHDGSLPTLEMAVTVMADHQLGRALSPAQVEDVVAFLESLTGSLPEAAP